MGLTQTVNNARVMHWFVLTYARISNHPAYLKTVNLKTTPLANPCFNLNNRFERPELNGEREREMHLREINGALTETTRHT